MLIICVTVTATKATTATLTAVIEFRASPSIGCSDNCTCKQPVHEGAHAITVGYCVQENLMDL